MDFWLFFVTLQTVMQENLKPIIIKTVTSLEEFNNVFNVYDSYWTIILVRSKGIKIRIGFKECYLKKNDLAILSEDLFCKPIEMADNSKLEIIIIKESFFNSSNYKLPSEFYNLVYLFPFVSLSKEEEKHYLSCMEFCKDISRGNFHNEEKILSNMINNIALISLEIWQKYSRNTTPLNDVDKVTQLNREFFNLLFQKANQYHNVGYYAKMLGISHNYLTFCVKYMTNQTPKQAIERQLINEIKHLLESTNLSLKEIAWQLNFSDASYLSRFFNRHCGLSPAIYRQNHSL